MTRVYLAADAEDLARLARGEALTGEQLIAASDDEEDELAALEEAAESGAVAIAAEVPRVDDPVMRTHVASFHVALDDTGHLQWFGPEELDTVRELISP